MQPMSYANGMPMMSSSSCVNATMGSFSKQHLAMGYTRCPSANSYIPQHPQMPGNYMSSAMSAGMHGGMSAGISGDMPGGMHDSMLDGMPGSMSGGMLSSVPGGMPAGVSGDRGPFRR